MVVVMRLVQIFKYACCLVSMILTSLFALTLSGIMFTDEAFGSGVSKDMLTAGLFVLIGCCIDFGKYLFWYERKRSHYYGFVGLVLTVFSLLASGFFFISAESAAFNNSRLLSMEYRALQERMRAVRQQINYQERLLEKRLSSDYHQQWLEGEKNVERLHELKGTLANLIEVSTTAGRETAVKEVPITRFFTMLGQVIGVSIDTVRNIGYGVLALLLEVTTLGAISLANSIQRNDGLVDKKSENGSAKIESPGEDSELRKRIINLSNDIVLGKVQPVIRKIRAAQYELDIAEIRQVLMNLYLAGLIEKDTRKSYKLICDL